MKFRRQVPVGPYIVDFYSVEIGLAIEMDGTQHAAAWKAEYDSERTRFLREHGIRVLRIPNELLIRDSLLVQQQIEAAILECTQPPHPPSAPSPPQAGEKDLD